MFVFGGRPGLVGTAVTDGALPFALVVGGGGATPQFPTPAVVKAVLTGFRFGDRSALGLAPTLRDRVYVWLFGEKPGTARITGFAFPDLCGYGTAPLPWTGLDGVHSYFEQARANTTGVPARLVFGPNTVRWGFLEELDFDLQDASTGVGTFELRFRTLAQSVIGGGSVPPPVWARVGG